MNTIDSTLSYAGVGRTDITPPPDCILDGFAARDHRAEGIHDHLTVTAAAFSRKNKTAVIAGIDLLELIDPQIDEIRKRVLDRCGIPQHRLFLNCSHTHAGPLMRKRYNRDFCPDNGFCSPDEKYVESAISAIVQAIGQAVDDLTPCKIHFGIGDTHIGICRRASDVSIYKGPASGYIGIYANIPNPDKVVDRTCPVIVARDMNGSDKLILFGSACHPTTMSHPNYLVSAEYPGKAREIIEQRHPGAMSLFIQGIGGDVKPKRVALEDSFKSGDFEDVDCVALELVDDVESVYADSMSEIDLEISSSSGRYHLPYNELWGKEKFIEYQAPEHSKYRRKWARSWDRHVDSGGEIPTYADINLAILNLNPRIRFLGIAGELLTDMGLKLKHQFSDGITLPCGYTNGRIGYIPDSKVLAEGGYEATETVFFTEQMPAPWRDDIDQTLFNAFEQLVKEAD